MSIQKKRPFAYKVSLTLRGFCGLLPHIGRLCCTSRYMVSSLCKNMYTGEHQMSAWEGHRRTEHCSTGDWKKTVDSIELERLYWKSLSIYVILILCQNILAQTKHFLPHGAVCLRTNL